MTGSNDQDRSRWLQDRSRWLQDRSRWLQDRSRWPSVGRLDERLQVRLRTRAALRWAPVLALWATFVATGLRGVDYGEHWDETLYQINPVRDMVASGVLLPPASIYPGLCRWLVLLPCIPPGIQAGLKKDGSPRTVQAAMRAAFDAPEYLLSVRRLFILISSLAIFWVYGAALALRRPRWEALIGAAGLGLSWEFAYHARYVATDCVLAQFAALVLLLLALFHRSDRAAWLHGAAVAAGLATGTKYTGVILLVPVIAASVSSVGRLGAIPQARRIAAICGLAFAAYLISTPATLLDPFKFLEQLRSISDIYSKAHGGYTATSIRHHVSIVVTYFAVSYFSPFRVPAVALFLATLAGAAVWLREDRRAGLLLVLFPVAFLTFFCSRYATVIVRNYLLLAPFLSVLAARGIAALCARLPTRWAPASLAAGLVALAIAHATWLVQAAESIRAVDEAAYVRQAVVYVAARSRSRFRLSPRVRAVAARQGLTLPPNVTGGPADVVVFFPRAEGPDVWVWPATDPWLTQAVFGPREVNFNFYPTWVGHDRVVAMTVAKADLTGVRLAD